MLMLKENEVRTRAQINAIQTPEPAKRWFPVGFGRSIDLLEETIERHNLEIVGAKFGLARGDTQLFGAFMVASGRDDQSLTIAIRNSINQTLSLGAIAGVRVSACSNLDLWSGSFRIVRKNTFNAVRDYQTLIDGLVRDALPTFAQKTAESDAWRQIPADLDSGYDVLGRMFGHGVLSSRQLSTAVEEWKHSSIPEHRERSAWGLYQAITQGLKQGSTATLIDRHSRARDYFADVIDAS